MKTFISDIAMIVIGIVLILYPGTSMDITIGVIGVLLLVAGVVGIILGFRGDEAYFAYTMTGAVVSVVAGIICLVKPEIIRDIVPLFMGVVILATGVFNIANAISAKRAGASRWVVSLILALITVILGIVILVNVDDTGKLLVQVIGMVFVYNGITTLLMRIFNRV
ncbi:MAG: DUF308 domain-containing protein [Lachnospiraceae bacterium]|nr:DUF308 domain-containing protein [Lachnospiraceae bacterium]